MSFLFQGATSLTAGDGSSCTPGEPGSGAVSTPGLSMTFVITSGGTTKSGLIAVKSGTGRGSSVLAPPSTLVFTSGDNPPSLPPATSVLISGT